MSEFAAALDVANAVLYEGYMLFPYTASTKKNRVRWQFGVAVPRAFACEHPEETSELEAAVLFEPGPAADVDVLLRFLHLERRTIEIATGDGTFRPALSLKVGDETFVEFDGAEERIVSAELRMDAPSVSAPFHFARTRVVEDCIDEAGVVRGRVTRESFPLDGMLSLRSEPVDGAPGVHALHLGVTNHSQLEGDGSREAALATSLLSTHLLMKISDGRFLSAIDPPGHLREATSNLGPRRLWPVLIGDGAEDERRAKLVLASPIILYDFPLVSPHTQGDAFDATEIDELISLSVLSLTDEERAEARAADPRARAIVERAERFGREQLERVHSGGLTRTGASPWGSGPFDGDPFAAVDVPSIDCVFVDGVKVSKGSTVRLQPKRRADVWDSFLAGKTATVSAIHQDVEDQLYVAVTVDDDPASDLHEWYGRSLFFYPDEIEPLVRETAQ
jgi:hypothetical protein